ncbi:MAG: ornithine carbamoyltransferase [Panacagrimonas sp.]
MTQHFLQLSDLSADQIRQLIERARQLKTSPDQAGRPFAGKTLAMIFAKNSTRTRVSFESGMARLGGHALFLQTSATQIGRSEPLADTARVISRMCDAVMIRNDSQADQVEFAEHSQVPVINGLSDLHHPCQLLADLQCWTEHRGDLKGKTAAWIGDGNNVCHSWVEAAQILGFKLRLACPPDYSADPRIIDAAGDAISISQTSAQAADGVDLIVTDTWTSMGQENEHNARIAAFKAYQVNSALMKLARPDALFMHCLPAHRGEEVTGEVIDGPQSVVWDEAENRMWAQMALLELLLKCT